MRLLFGGVLAMFLTACNDPNIQQTAENLNLDQIGDIGMNLLANGAKNECQNQLSNGQAWADLVLTAEQKSNICTCVADELKTNINAQTLSEVIKDGQINTSVLTTKVTGVMAVCTAPERLNSSPTTANNQQNAQSSQASTQ